MSQLLENSATNPALRFVEADLLRSTGGAAIEWYGRAATALYRAYQIARLVAGQREDAEIILPSISCATPANTALLAGVTPRFADVDPLTGMLRLEDIQARWTPKTCAVVFIHLFGQTAELQVLADWCRRRNVLLIEDLAQALSARLQDGSPAGSMGDLSVYSFNPTKILECGGGALAIRSVENERFLRELCASDPLPANVPDEETRVLALSYRNLHHALVGLLRTRAIADASTSFLKLQPAFKALYLKPMKSAADLSKGWERLSGIVNHRYSNAECYEESLSGGPWTQIGGWRRSGVCWRYSLLVDFPDHLVEFSEAVRRDGFHVSNLYWPVNDFFRPADPCPNAERFARRILNLWVDGSVDRAWVRKCSENLLKNAERFSA
ncbi:MAG TPA: DegT/DnrJ/EryC1/StrS family aminotransferase [Candidatus Sulfotelmatobacter sp.]|nr:DegT/DnrJ/EryC1/StrS family aminotransferase [Candidatus Sulfotelmatobacter sp.]